MSVRGAKLSGLWAGLGLGPSLGLMIFKLRRFKDPVGCWASGFGVAGRPQKQQRLERMNSGATTRTRTRQKEYEQLHDDETKH